MPFGFHVRLHKLQSRVICLRGAILDEFAESHDTIVFVFFTTKNFMELCMLGQQLLDLFGVFVIFDLSIVESLKTDICQNPVKATYVYNSIDNTFFSIL